MSAAKALLQGFVARLLPMPFMDDRDDAKPARLGRYGEQKFSEFDKSLYGYAEEGTLMVATTTTPGTGFTWSNTGNGTQSFLDTAPQLYIFNQEPAGGKSIYLSHVKLICTTTPTAATGGKYAFFMDSAARSFSTDSGTALSVVCPNANASVPVAMTCKLQNSATPSVAAAIVNSRRIAQGWLVGAIPLIGDEYIMSFGRGDIAGHPGTINGAAVIPRKLVSNNPPVIIPPQSSLMGHFWFPALTTASIVPECEIVMWAR